MQRIHFIYPSWSGGRGLGFALTRRDGRTYVTHGGWIGGHRTDFILDPERKLAAIALTNADDASPGLFARQALDVVGSAIAASAAAASKPSASTPPDPAWQRYVGRYTDPWDWQIDVLVVDGTLCLDEQSYPPSEDADESLTRLTPAPDGTFRTPDGETVRFELGADGKVVKMYRRADYYVPVR